MSRFWRNCRPSQTALQPGWWLRIAHWAAQSFRPLGFRCLLNVSRQWFWKPTGLPPARPPLTAKARQQAAMSALPFSCASAHNSGARFLKNINKNNNGLNDIDFSVGSSIRNFDY